MYRTPLPSRHRRRWPWLPVLIVVAALAAGAAVAFVPVPSGGTAVGSPRPSAISARPPATSTSAPATVPLAPAPIRYPETGSRSYRVAPGTSAVVGTAGSLLRFRVAVESDITGAEPSDFAAQVVATYGDPQGWTAGGRWRFQRVGPDGPADFEVYLVTPATRDALCQDGHDRFTSCREGNRVVLNVARWRDGVPDYGAPQAVYRQYMVNHETGHRLGFGHELCPGAGRPAPVMQQQTLGLHGCTANAWPYPDGQSYHGVSGNYPR